MTSHPNCYPEGEYAADARRALNLLRAEDDRQSKLHELLERIREQIRIGVEPEHRPEGLFKNIQDAVYAMRGRTPLMDDAAITHVLGVAQGARAAAIEECAQFLKASFPEHAWLNAACATLRSLAHPSTTMDRVCICGATFGQHIARTIASAQPSVDGHGYSGPFTATEFNERAWDHEKAAKNGLSAGPNVSYVRTFQACAVALRYAAKHMPFEPTASQLSSTRRESENEVCDLQALLEIRDFLADIVGGAEVTERSRDAATGFVAIMDTRFKTAWSSTHSSTDVGGGK